MNFDGKALILDTSINYFVSNNDSAFVENLNKKVINESYITKGATSIYLKDKRKNQKNINNFFECYSYGLIPYTAYVDEVRPSINTLNFVRFSKIRDKQIQENQIFNYSAPRSYIISLQPTNIKYNPKSVTVTELIYKQKEKSLTSTSVNVHNKVEVIIPDKISNYTDISLVVQKDCFLEIKISNSATNVTDIPEGLTYIPGYIKGSFLKSGEYNIKIHYSDGEQIINIIVPYYKRLL